MIRKISSFAVATALLAVCAAPAFAECDEAPEQAAGKAVAAATQVKVNDLIPNQTKQMMSLELCNAVGGGNMYVEFKYNILSGDGLYWVSGTARTNGSAVTDLKFRSMSPNLASASAKAGVKLASN